MTHTPLQDLGNAHPTALTVGFFDGVHLGHQAVLNRVISAAKRLNARSVVVTFDPHPKTVLTGEATALLSTLDEKSALLVATGIDVVVVVPFDHALSELTAREFVSDILLRQIGGTHIVVGYDHSMGKGAAGDAATIVELGRDLGFTTDVIQPRSGSYGTISSSRIREILRREGDVAGVAEQLGRLYRLSGRVVRGDGRGKQLGFPTANLDLTEPSKVVPANGVYAVHVTRHSDNTRHHGIMNIGVRPTLTAGRTRVLEVYLLEFEDDLYDETLTVSFIERVREERKFDGVDALIEQIQDDISDCIRITGVLS